MFKGGPIAGESLISLEEMLFTFLQGLLDWPQPFFSAKEMKKK
jgi:hypothetical protein